MLRLHPRAIFLALSAFAAACGGGYDDDGSTGPTPSFELAVTPTSLSIQAGSSASLDVSIARTSFSEVVSVAIENLPAGVTAPAATIAGSATTVRVTLSVASTAASGTSSFTVRATGSGVAQRTATVQLTITPAPVPSIAMTVAPTTLSIALGLSASANLTITRSNYSGDVSLSAVGGPAGMSFAFAPASVTGTTSSMTVSVGTSVVPGAYTITVQATGTGVPIATATLAVTVTGPPASIGLSAAPTTLTIQQGQSGTAQLTITRTNFLGAVNLTASGAQPGMTVTVSPNSTMATSVAVTVAVSATLVAGAYSFTIQAAATGVASVSLTIPVTVTVPGPGNVTFTFCAQSGLPLWFAFSDNGGAFTRVAGTNGVMNFTVGQRGRVAWVMQDGTKTRLELFYGSLQDLNARGRSFCRGDGSVKGINGTVSGLTGSQRASIWMGGSSAQVLGSGVPTFGLANVPDGLVDLIAVRSDVTSPNVPNSILVQRDRNDANGSLISVDLNVGVAPVARTATLANLGADVASMTASVLSKNGTLASLSFDLPGTAPTRSWFSLPDASVTNGDWHLQSVIATPPTSTDGFPFRSYSLFTRLGGDRTVTLPDHITTAPTFVVSSTVPYVTLTSLWVIQSAQYNDFWSLMFTPASGSVSSVTISGTAGYFGSGPARLDLPAFDATFNPQHGLQSGISLSWTFFAAGGTAWGNSIGHAPLPNEGEFGTTAGIRGLAFTP
jgi:hypothetical protein